MKLKDQVCSIELAKKLKELGVKQESAFSWFAFTNENELRWVLELTEITDFPDVVKRYAAFTVAELGEMLPMDRICTNKNKKFAIWFESAIAPTESVITGDTEACARAKLLIHIIEKGIVDAEKIN